MTGILENYIGFEWDKGNSLKNSFRHQVSDSECEQVFFNIPMITMNDEKHSEKEVRWNILGKTNSDRFLFLVFTVRNQLIRIISARDMNKKRDRFTMKKFKKIPVFNTEEEEREFWATNDSTEYIDWNKSERMVFPNLKPSTTTISLRLPQYMLDEIKMIAHERDVPYQSLIKVFLKERLTAEFRNKDN